jgi:aerobic-type carbon monoxide dehydrogenase small subunit (CoxS/CutS family)
MPLDYVVSTAIMKWFVFFMTFIKQKKLFQLSVNLGKNILVHRVRHMTGTGKNTNGACSVPVDEKGLSSNLTLITHLLTWIISNTDQMHENQEQQINF